MNTKVVVSVSVGTGLLLVGLALFISVSIAVAAIEIHGRTSPPPDVFRPKAGALGEVKRTMNEIEYGPVNLNAAKEVKNGGLFRGGLISRIQENRQLIRENRQSRICSQVQSCSSVQQSYQTRCASPAVVQSVCVPFETTTYTVPQSSNSAIATDLYIRDSRLARPYLVVPPENSGAVEYPAVNPLEVESKDCPSCHASTEVNKILSKKVSPRAELKTGAFICSHCRKPCVGHEFHTDWAEDGTPITFLCERCYSRMNGTQRIAAYKAYAARQTAAQGKEGLLHQEIGQ